MKWIGRCQEIKFTSQMSVWYGGLVVGLNSVFEKNGLRTMTFVFSLLLINVVKLVSEMCQVLVIIKRRGCVFKVHVLWHSHILLKSNTVELWSLNCYLFFSIDEQWVVSERSTWMVQKMERGIMEWRTWSTSGESPADVRLNGGNVGNYILHMHI